jgi:hypothetical protein
MMSLRSLVLSAALLTSGLLGIVGCDSIDAAFDCQSVCDRYQTCYQANYDVDACRSRCRTASANDPSVREAANTCEQCIGDKSCLSATFQCGGSCGQIVP